MTFRVVTTLLLAWLLLPQTAGDATSITYPAGKGAGQGRHVVLLAGDEEYRSEEALPMLAKILSQRHGFKTTVLFSGGSRRNDQPEERRLAFWCHGARLSRCDCDVAAFPRLAG